MHNDIDMIYGILFIPINILSCKKPIHIDNISIYNMQFT